jgi:hypothetical protein
VELQTPQHISPVVRFLVFQAAKEEKRKLKDGKEKESQKAVYNHELSDN